VQGTRQLKATQRNQDKYIRKEQRPNMRSTVPAAHDATYTALTSAGSSGGGSKVILTKKGSNSKLRYS